MNETTGTLYVMATPIGNLKDITYRGVEVLKKVDGIIAEDTRESKKILEEYGIDTPFTRSYYQGASDRVQWYIEKIKEGKNFALISDAGTPLISDPGFELVRAAKRASISRVPVPGANAAISALSVSGLPTDSFIFDGMLPRKEAKKRKYLESLKNQKRTIVLYESPHRIVESLEMMGEILPERQIALCREMTKLHEEILEGTSSQVINRLTEEGVRGEMTLVIEGASEGEIKRRKKEKYSGLSFSDQLDALMNIKKLSRKEAMKRIAELRGMSKNEVYERLLEEKEDRGKY